jgi:hypothetical protein
MVLVLCLQYVGIVYLISFRNWSKQFYNVNILSFKPEVRETIIIRPLLLLLYEKNDFLFKKLDIPDTPIILATWKAEIRKIDVGGQPG